MRRGRLLVLIGFAVAIAVAVGVFVVASLGSDEVEFRPDLDQAAPGELSGRTAGTPASPRFFLGFESAAGNVGGGPLIVLGNRGGTDDAEMNVRQEVLRSDGSTRTVETNASLTYVRSADHSHWHLGDFMRYELRRADGAVVAPDRKTGFCLGDRYELGVRLERAPPAPGFPEECGKGEPGLLEVREGISVGYGDDYDAHLEGQEFDVTGLPAGRYLLVHRVNSSRALEETDYGNNASSLAFRLTWPGGRQKSPRVDVLGRCPNSATCPR